MACYQAPGPRGSELAQAQVLQNVSDELKRAKRTEDENGSMRRGRPVAAVRAGRRRFTLAACRGDAEGLCQLLDRYERLQSGRTMSYYYTGSYYFAGPGPACRKG